MEEEAEIQPIPDIFIPLYVEETRPGAIEIDPFITHTMGLDQINTAFDLMHEGKSIRSVILFDK